VKDRIRCELVKLHTVNKKKPTKKFIGRKRESAEKERKKHHPIATWGLGDPFGARELDKITAGDETICLGLFQLLLRGSRGHPASHGARSLPFGHAVLHCQVFHAHLRIYAQGKSRAQGSAMAAAAERKS
jgi:hypothetical protein